MSIYLNNASTTKPVKKVIEDFVCCAQNIWANPSDKSEDGLLAKNVIRVAQKQVADSINAKPSEIIFTSGGTESNNWAIKGFLNKNTGYKTIITTPIEHPSVYNTCQFMSKFGINLRFVKIDKYGIVDLKDLERMLSDEFSDGKPLVSIMFANNEIGTMQDIKSISELVHKYNGILHVDAVQVYMHTKIDVQELGIDMMSTSFHKFGGFKNCGFLYIRDGLELTPLLHGGRQFDSKRSGTENVPMIYAMGKQVERLSEENVFKTRLRMLEDIYQYTILQLEKALSDADYTSAAAASIAPFKLNGHPSKRLYTNISITISGIDASVLISLLESEGIYVSAGSACCSGEKTPSRVLTSIRLKPAEAFSTIRISLTEETSKKDIDMFVDILAKHVNGLKMFGK